MILVTYKFTIFVTWITWFQKQHIYTKFDGIILHILVFLWSIIYFHFESMISKYFIDGTIHSLPEQKLGIVCEHETPDWSAWQWYCPLWREENPTFGQWHEPTNRLASWTLPPQLHQVTIIWNNTITHNKNISTLRPSRSGTWLTDK